MSAIATELIVIVLLLTVNGLLAMSELAVVTARKVRLEQRAEEGDAGAMAALALARDPGQFLSTVQVGITLIGVLAGAFGGATLSEELADGLEHFAPVAEYADAIALGIVVAGITYLSLLIGELIPKRVALSQPERVASLVARPMKVLARAAAPIVALLTGPTNLVLRFFGIRVSAEPSITVKEIRALVEQGAESGVVEDTEHHLVERVFRLGDRLVSDIMTPRTQLEWVDLSEPADLVRRQLAAQLRARYVVCERTIENVLGVAHAEDLLAQCLGGQPLDLRPVLRQPLYVPATMAALDVLEQFKTSRQHVAVVLDEYGGMQ
ncbi:MAG: hemolysin family protein, partial [Gemmatimonadota bacterium]